MDLDPELEPDEDVEEDVFVHVDALRRNGHRKRPVTEVVDLTEPET